MKSRNLRVCLNLGSGDFTDLVQRKPWIEENIFLPLRTAGVKIINVDSRDFKGVDYIGDLCSLEAFNFLEGLEKPRFFILANVLEHIETSSRNNLIRRIYELMNQGDGLVITVPHDYPYHPDPIDTMFRPAPQDLTELVPLTWLDQTIVEAGSFKEEFQKMGFLKRMRKILRPIWPLQSYSAWRRSLRILWFFKPYKVTVVFGIKG